VPPSEGNDPEIAAIIRGAIAEAAAQNSPIVSYDCGPLEGQQILCSVSFPDGTGMYLVISVGASGRYSWELMGGM